MKHLQRVALMGIMLVSIITAGCGPIANSTPAGSVSSNQQTSATTSTESSATTLSQDTVTTTSASTTVTETITATAIVTPTTAPTLVPTTAPTLTPTTAPILVPTTAPTLAPTPIPPTPIPAAPRPTVAPPPPPKTSTITFDETFVKNAVNAALAQRKTQYPVTVTSVSLQNGEIILYIVVTTPIRALNGTIVATMTASNCALYATVISGNAGPLTLNDAQKAQIDAALDAAFARKLASLGPNTCADSVVIANGEIIVTYH